MRVKGYFPINPAAIKPEHIYVFVLLNKPGEAVQYFIVPGELLVDGAERFDYRDPKFPGIYAKLLAEFEGAWSNFGC